jgi:metacaspase-1
MTKKALCVGINDYPYEENDLNGCVNDANAWAELLIGHFGFPKSNVKIVLDDKATKASIMKALTNLVTKAKAGDVLVFTNSSHGTYVADESDDEFMYDEAMCPFDAEDNLIVDDELRELFTTLADDVSLTVISDSCFSGTVTRAIVFPKTPDNRRMRFLNPEHIGKRAYDKAKLDKMKKGKTKFPESKMKDILLSGCTDKQYSYDAEIDGVYHGAMTYFALQAIQEADYTITYQDLHKRLTKLLKDSNFDQTPRLEGKKEKKMSQIFT